MKVKIKIYMTLVDWRENAFMGLYHALANSVAWANSFCHLSLDGKVENPKMCPIVLLASFQSKGFYNGFQRDVLMNKSVTFLY